MDDIFAKFIRDADDINETWKIVEFFENELTKFKNEVSNYQSYISKERDSIKSLRAQFNSIDNELKSKQQELESINNEINNARIELENIKKDQSNTDSIDITSFNDVKVAVQVRPLDKVSILLKDGIVVKANPATDVYPKELLDKYIISLREIKILRSKLNSSDLENARLKNEMKDIKSNI